MQDAVLDADNSGKAWERDTENSDKRLAYAQDLIASISWQENALTAADAVIQQAELERSPVVVAEMLVGRAGQSHWLEQTKLMFHRVTGRPWKPPLAD